MFYYISDIKYELFDQGDKTIQPMDKRSFLKFEAILSSFCQNFGLYDLSSKSIQSADKYPLLKFEIVTATIYKTNDAG